MPSAHQVFVSYSHRDRKHLDRLRVHMRPLERAGLVDLWDDTRIAAGGKWRSEIAQAAVLLVSADFLASAFIVENELPPLLSAAKGGGTTILPVIVSASRFERTPTLSSFQAVNSPSRPLAGLPAAERERVWVEVANAVEAALQDRPPEQGWAASNEKRVLEALNQLVNSPGSSFLIISSGDYYVQFILEGAEVHCEAVSNHYLDSKSQIAKRAVDRLVELGFNQPQGELQNFSRKYSLAEVASAPERIAAMAVQVMAEVYDVSRNAELRQKLVVDEGR